MTTAPTPCKNCGKPPVLKTEEDDDELVYFYYCETCDHCGDMHVGFHAEEGAAEAWNEDMKRTKYGQIRRRPMGPKKTDYRGMLIEALAWMKDTDCLWCFKDYLNCGRYR